jgi:hypothetical protein
MGFSEWLDEFRGMHEKARAGKLDERGNKAYVTARDELATALITAQRLSLDPAVAARNALRVARAMQIDLDLASGKVRALTLDISVSGFSAMLGRQPDATEVVGYSLRMSDGQPLEGRASVQGTRRQGASYRVSFAFRDLGDEDAERLSLAVFDAALGQLQRR